MAPERKRQLLLGGLTIVLAIMVYRAWPRPAPVPSSSSNPAGRTARAAQNGQHAAEAAPDVRLEELQAERPKPAPAERNLFRFQPKAPPPSRANAHRAEDVPPNPGPPPPAAPQIALKFIGIIEAPGRKIAVLSDGRGIPLRGTEGDVILGQYRILKIGVESVELAYLDGHGRTTIRLTGS